ncbi:MAG: STAS domain-containing protein [Deltaproteobacteria bacterium]|nr:STAS domain-containing protein [Deltaproteobacteria bacterium]
MNCDVTEQGKAVVVELKEERLDAHNSNEFKSQMLSLFEGGKNNMVINLKGVRFIDSSGLGALVSGFKNATARNGSLKLCGLQPQVKSMFELTRLHRVFEIFPDTEAAVASF